MEVLKYPKFTRHQPPSNTLEYSEANAINHMTQGIKVALCAVQIQCCFYIFVELVISRLRSYFLTDYDGG